MYVSLKQAGEATGVPYLIIAGMIRDGRIASRSADNKTRSPLVREADFDLIRSIYTDEPAEGDPTPEEINERCAAVRAAREAQRQHERREFDRLCDRAVRVLASGAAGIGGLMAATGISVNVAQEVMTKLVADGRVVSTGTKNGCRYQATDRDSTDRILRQFRRRARRHVRNRHQRQAIAA